MLPTFAYLSAALCVCLVAVSVLWWGRLPGEWRRVVALFASIGGLASLLVAINSEGVREAATVGFVLATPYVTEQASASVSLPYYVLTGIGLLLGTAGLAVSDQAATRLARSWFTSAVVLSLLMTATRFALEKVAAPRFWTLPVGITWLAPLVGAFFATNLRDEGKGLRHLVAALLGYAYAVRGAVAALMFVASKEGLGSHYDVSSIVRVQNPFTGQIHEFVPGSFSQVMSLGLIPQLVIWPVYTLLAGLLGAGVAWVVIESAGPTQPAPARHALNAEPAPEDR
jgi:hypothetical protein